MPKPKILAISVPALMVVAVMGWLAGTMVGESSWLLWPIRALVWTLGSLVVFFVVRLFKGSGGPATRSEPDPVDALIAQATKRLNAIGVRGRDALTKLPVVLILGPKGSAKTTFVLQSDLDAELLAGNPHFGEMVAPTDAVNVWYRDGQLLLEAAGQLSVEPARWARLVSRLHSAKWLQSVLGRPQAPRVAVVCFSVEELLGPAASDSPIAAARNLRARLSELAEAIGIRLPVYVVFTKTDRIPHFEDFARNLTDGDIHELLGATLRTSGDTAGGSYAERETERLTRAFEELYHGLAERRLDLIARSGTTQGNGAAYEFPREFRKTSRAAVQFLIELCRPSQLRMSPFLRGFYFAGVRPVVAREGVNEPASPPAFQSAMPAGATQVFNLNQLQPQQSRTTNPSRTQERRVPQWVFLDRILQRVIFLDRVAMGITTSGVGQTERRRITMAAGIALCFTMSVTTLLAWDHERDLQEDTETALQGVANLTAPVGLATLEQLQPLERLRAVTETLSKYEHGRGPLRQVILMHTGSDLYEQARTAYFRRLRPVLFQPTFESLKLDLSDLPPNPTLDRYERVYESLKAYVEITEHHDSATADFFGRVLTDRWVGQSVPDEEKRALGQAQFAFYGAELPHRNPYPDALPELPLRERARSFLSTNANDSSFYRGLVGQWNQLPWGILANDRPDTRGLLTSTLEVPGAFTRAGWDSVHAQLSSQNPFSRSPHVVGDGFYRVAGINPDSLPRILQREYEKDYRETWLQFLRDAQLETLTLQNGEGRLTRLGEASSPLFQLFEYVDLHTTVDNAEIQSTFGVLKRMLGPDSVPQQLVSDKPGLDYLRLLPELALAVGRLNASPGTAAEALRAASDKGVNFVGALATEFPTEPPPAQQVGISLRALLSAPFVKGGELAEQGPAAAATQLAASFCTTWGNRVFNMFPFRAQAPEASVDDVIALLNPQGGELEKFLDQIEATGAAQSNEFINFRRRAIAVRSAFYPPGSTAPGFDLTFSLIVPPGIDRVVLRIDGTPYTFTPTLTDTERLAWSARATQVALEIRSGDRVISPLQFDGTWAMFHFFNAGEWANASGGTYRVTWSQGGVTLSADVRFREANAPVLQRSFMSLSCPRRASQ
jgi:type VI secretion system protein ImpL